MFVSRRRLLQGTSGSIALTALAQLALSKRAFSLITNPQRPPNVPPSPAVLASLTMAFSTYNRAVNARQSLNIPSLLLRQAFSTYVNNLNETSYFTSLDVLFASSPELFATPLTYEQAETIANTANAYSANTTAAIIQERLTLPPSTLQTLLSKVQASGSYYLFSNVAAQVGKGTVSLPGYTPPSTEARREGGDPSSCTSIFYLGVVAGLTGNEIAAAICAVAYYTYCD